LGPVETFYRALLFSRFIAIDGIDSITMPEADRT
jgi:hypothetical protein